MKKMRGFILFELFLSFSLSAILFFMLYQIYKGVQNTLYYVGQESLFDIQKNVAFNNLSSDLMQAIFPAGIVELHKKVLAWQKKKPSSTEEDKKQEQEITELYNYMKFYFPCLEKTEKETTIYFISARSLFGKKNVTTKVAYIFKKKINVIKQKEYYALYRKESYYDINHAIIKEGKEHLLVPIIVDLEVDFVLPDVSHIQKENKNEVDKNGKKKEFDGFYKWINQKKYSKVDRYTVPETMPKGSTDQKNYLQSVTLLPYTIHIKGNVTTLDFSKNKDFEIFVDLPYTDHFLQVILNQDIFSEVADGKEEKNEEKK